MRRASGECVHALASPRLARSARRCRRRDAARGFRAARRGRSRRRGRSAGAARLRVRGPLARIARAASPTGTFCAGRDEHPLDHAVVEDLDLDLGLVGVDHGDDVAARARGRPGCTRHSRIVPASMSAPSDGIRNSAIGPPPAARRTARDDRARDLRQRGVLEVLRVRHRHLGAAHARDRRVELVEGAAPTMRAATSAARLPLRQPSSTITARCVRATDVEDRRRRRAAAARAGRAPPPRCPRAASASAAASVLPSVPP